VRRSTRSAPDPRRQPHAARRSRRAASSTAPRLCRVSNVMLVCPTCKLPTRVGYTTKDVKARRSRFASASETAAARRSTGNGCAETYSRVSRQRYNESSQQLQESSGCVDHAIAVRRQDHASTWASARARPTRADRCRARRLTIIAGSAHRCARPQVDRAVQDPAGDAIGVKVTARHRMWEFLDRLSSDRAAAHPHFRGLNPDSSTPRQLSLGISRADHLFPRSTRQHHQIRGLRRRDHDDRRTTMRPARAYGAGHAVRGGRREQIVQRSRWS